MKKLILFILFIPLLAAAQNTTALPGGTSSVTPQYRVTGADSLKQIWAVWPAPFTGVNRMISFTEFNKYIGKTVKDSISVKSNRAFDGSRPITNTVTGLTGVNPGTSTVLAFLEAVFYPTQVPTATLTGGTSYELTVSNITHNLSWTYGRQVATATITSAVINPGAFNVFGSQPSQPGTVNGTRSVTTTANTNTTYTLTVTTTDSKTAVGITTDTFLPRLFYGRSTSTAPTQSEILAFSGGSNPLSSGHSGTYTIVASGSNYPFFAYASSQGTIVSILDINGFNVTSSFVTNTLSLTNSQGFTQLYRSYTLNSTTAANYTITIN